MSVSAALALLSAATAPAAPALDLVLKPLAGPDGAVADLEVTARFDSFAVNASDPLLRLPLVVSNVDTAATTLRDLAVRDRRGPVALRQRDVTGPVATTRDAETGGPAREWFAPRGVTGPVTVRYRVAARALLPPRGPAPPFSLSADGRAVSGAGHVFLLLPRGAPRYRLRLDWDLSALPAGAHAASSFGIGDVAPAKPVKAADLRSAFYMAGAMTLHRPDPQVPFFMATQGRAPFDDAAMAQWAGALHAHYARFFGRTDTPSYGVFLRHNPVNAGGGVGLHDSFVLTYGENGSDPAKLRITLAHEMFHTFQPFLADPPGLASSWFGEGLASLYMIRLPLRFGQITPADFLDQVNFAAARYYTSLMAGVPNAEVPARFWADTRIRTLAYDRGMMWFAALDRQVRNASGGKRSLDDLMLAMLARQNAAGQATQADWEAVLRAELGDEAVADFRAFLGGRVPLPPSDAFGPCFRRTTARLRRYELGFEPAVLAEPVRVVRGLVPGSAAAAAGLRDGDVIVDPVPQDGIQGDQARLLELKVRRGDAVRTIRYLPRGETVDAWQWERVPGVPDAACAL